MRLAILGPLEVRVGDRAGDAVVPIGGGRQRGLLMRLAIEPGRLVTAERLIDDLWGDAVPAEAGNALHAAVSRLRRALRAGGVDDAVLESSAAGYWLALPRDAVDAGRFAELLARAGAASRADEPRRAFDLLSEALGLWRGPALAGGLAAPFAATAAAGLEQRRLAACEDRVEVGLRLGLHARLVAESERLCAEFPLRERSCALHMRVLVGVGRQADALAAYERTRRALADELGVDPGAELAGTHLSVLRGELQGAAPSERDVSGSGAPSGASVLPAQLTSFVGRDAEMRLVEKLLTQHRLVTLTGPGGSGKTRLALELAGRLRPQLPDGLLLVELASVRDPAELPQALLTAVGVHKSLVDRGLVRTGSSTTDRLVGTLRESASLLVLDNCEHLIEATAELTATLLAACPSVRVLATSREPLAIGGEALCPVPPLALPPPGTDPAEARRYAAALLFADRAAAADPGFAPDDADTELLVEVCRRLDGMPLAIELAAARVRSLSLPLLARRLDDRFLLLTGGSRAALPRHRTLRAVVEWSWDLLDADEQAVLRRMSVFAGGATVDAIEQVCGGELRTLLSLVDKSLVEVVRSERSRAAGDTRYRLLETVREYGAERLADADETSAVGAAHATYFRDLIERAEPELRGSRQLRWIVPLNAEQDNLIAALRWAVRTRDTDLAVRIGAASGWLWTISGRHDDAAVHLSAAVAAEERDPGRAGRVAFAQLLSYAAVNVAASGDTKRAMALLDRARAVIAEHDLGAAHPVLWLVEPAAALFGTPLSERDRAHALRLVDQGTDSSDPWVRGLAWTLRGHLMDSAADMAAASAAARAALAAFRESGDRWGMSIALASLAQQPDMDDRPEEALALFREAGALLDQLWATEDVPQTKVEIARQLFYMDDLDGARAELLAAEAGLRGARGGTSEATRAYVELGFGELALHAGDLDEAERRLRLALRMIDSVTVAASPQFRAIGLLPLGMVLARRGAYDEAAAGYQEAIRLAHRAPDWPITARVIYGMADLAVSQGCYERTARLAGMSASVRGASRNRLIELSLARASDALGRSRYQELFDAGAALSLAEILAEVRDDTSADAGADAGTDAGAARHAPE
jgi:predicted ATPase/DNA-binding SARP family transcriptional activator/tetratricopeptide (TPR) repeat protein